MLQQEPVDLTTDEMICREELLELFPIAIDTFLLIEAITCHLDAATMSRALIEYRFEVYSQLDLLSTGCIPLKEDVLMLRHQILSIFLPDEPQQRETVLRTVQEVASRLKIPSFCPTPSELYDIDETIEMLDDIRDMPHVPIPLTMEENVIFGSCIHLFMKGTITSESNPSEFRQMCEAINTCYKLSEISMWWLQTKMRVSKMIVETFLPIMIALGRKISIKQLWNLMHKNFEQMRCHSYKELFKVVKKQLREVLQQSATRKLSVSIEGPSLSSYTSTTDTTVCSFPARNQKLSVKYLDEFKEVLSKTRFGEHPDFVSIFFFVLRMRKFNFLSKNRVFPEHPMDKNHNPILMSKEEEFAQAESFFCKIQVKEPVDQETNTDDYEMAPGTSASFEMPVLLFKKNKSSHQRSVAYIISQNFPTAMFEAYSVSDVVLNLPQEISSLCCRKTTQSVLAGSRDGTLFAHKIVNRGTGAIPKYAFEYIAKKFERHPVMNMTICEEKNLILCTSQGLLTAHILNDLQHPVINILHNVKPIQSFATWIREDDDHLYIVTSSRKKIQLFRWIDKEFQELALHCGIIFPETPLNLTMCKDALIFSVRDEYYVALIQKPRDDDEIWALELRKFASTEFSPVILYLEDHNLIGVCRNDMLCFFSPERELEKRFEKPATDIRYSEAPLALAYDPPYVVALLSKGKIEIRSFNPSMCVQNIVLSKAQFICSGNRGQIYVGSSTGVNRIWVLDSAPNLRKNVATLVSEKYFDLAIQIADLSKVFSEENKTEIKRQAAANLFNQRKFEESFQLHMQIGSDVLQVIRLIPDLLPNIAKPSQTSGDLTANEKKRALLAMGNYLSAIRADYVKKNDPKAGITLTKEEIQNIHRTMIIIDTTLLNCYLQTKPILVDSLLRLHNNSCAFEDAQAILKKAHKLPSLFVLYETKKKHELALELLYEQSENPDADFFFEGNERIVDYLQSLGNTHLELIFDYAKKILARSQEDGLSIFTGEESDVARSLDREKVLEFLKSSCTAVVIPYLEHIIYKWEEVRPGFHEALLENYINTVKKLMEDYVHAFKDGILTTNYINNDEVLDENINRAGEEEGDLGIYRAKLIHFLQYSLQYNPQGILFQLSSLPLYEERALILGRLKMHEQALTIYTSILNDFEAAEIYCQLYYDKNDTINSQVYLQWLRAYIQPYEPQKAGLTETPFLAPPPDVCSAIRVLSRHADRIDTVSALEDFPDETELRILSRALIAVLQTVRDNSISLSMRQSVSESALNYAEARLKQLESIRVVITNSSDCMKCGKKIGNSAFVRSPVDESLVHFYCNK